MSRTSGFNAIKRALSRSLFLARHPELKQALEDYEFSKGRQTSHERRAFLKSSIALGVSALPLTTLIANCATAPTSIASSTDHSPVAILGGGLAGLTAAYRLSQAGVRCSIYEAQPRLGGRVFTQSAFNHEGMFCELGGELVDSSHEDLIALGKELGVQFDDFRPFDAEVLHHQYYVDGQHRFDADLTAACGPLAKHLLADMQEVFADFTDPVCNYQEFTPAAKKFDGISLQEYLYGLPDVDQWIKDAINIAYLTEFGLDTGEQNVLNLMMLIDPVAEHGFGIYGASDEAMRVHGGNSRLVEAVAAAVRAKMPVHTEHQLVRMEDKGEEFALSFSRGKGAATQTVRASRVICTIPFSVLRDVEGVSTLGLSPVKAKCIATMSYGKNTKRILGFNERAWRKPHGKRAGASGYTFTDLPSQTFWDSSRVQPGRSGIITTFLGGSAAVDLARGSTESILADLETIYPGTRRHFDRNETTMRWPTHPYVKGSYACPTVGQYTTILGSPKEPELNGRLLFAGEHVSEKYQGYMNGAVQTGNEAAQALISEIKGAAPAPAHRPKRHRAVAPAV